MAEKIEADEDRLISVLLIKTNHFDRFCYNTTFSIYKTKKNSSYVLFYLLHHFPNFDNKILCVLHIQTCRNLKLINFSNFLCITGPSKYKKIIIKKYTLLLNLMGQKPIIIFLKKIIFIV